MESIAELRIGFVGGENVTIHLPHYVNNSGEWLQIRVSIEIDGFSASISPDIQIYDLSTFREQLIELNQSLSGAARLLPAEGQFGLELSGNGLGQIIANGFAIHDMVNGSRLEYKFFLDQTYLSGPIKVINRFLSSQVLTYQ